MKQSTKIINCRAEMNGAIAMLTGIDRQLRDNLRLCSPERQEYVDDARQAIREAIEKVEEARRNLNALSPNRP